MSGRLTTGITVLDRELGGGLPEGSIVALLADPASQSELFLYELSAVRGTLYLTTIRSGQAVNDAIARAPRSGSPTVRDVGGEAPLDAANKLVHDLPERSNLVVDVVDVLESTDPVRYRQFLNSLQTHMVNTGGIAVLHGMKGDAHANRRYTKHMSDVVFDLQTSIDGAEIENRLAVPKFRGGRALEETIKLRLSEAVTVDTSRDIA
ncbi:RAD55 family ATPase [Halogeometricum limi]|uniref:RecA-superfamily ATPase, KaiC/GvpD/RAD55 family n=1 Tax=Halogeometricum limi TaxID=555875 RepID=A0A1I6IQH8_9EURY|nr:transcriptional regulator [Halogeometricum limi]SFR68968.1 hypothetical protein SAMN04488124_3508 [Halogeometricum limi]